MSARMSVLLWAWGVWAVTACAPAGPRYPAADLPPPSPSPVLSTAAAYQVPVGPVDLDDILRLVREAHPTVQAARQRVEATGWRIDQQRAWPDPRLVIENLRPDDGRQEPQVMLMQRLPWFGSRERLGAVATAEVQVAMQELIAVELAVERDLRILHYRWQESMQRRSLVAEAHARSVQVVEGMQARVATGTDQVALIDRQRDVAVVADRLRRLDDEISHWRRRLLVRAGLGADTQLAMPSGLPTPPPSDLAAWVEARLEDHAVALQLLRRRVAVAAERITLAQRQAWPEPSVGLGYDRAMMHDERWMLSLAVSLPLARTARHAAVAEAQARHRAAQFDLLDQRQRLDDMVTKRLFAINDAHRQETLAREVLLDSAQRAQELIEQAYRAGRRDAGAVLDRDLAILQAREALLGARFAQVVAAAELAALVGGVP